ncbi:MAG: transcription-repair coupling factor [Bacteroidales bacterium]|nr:MAG: transcription-repair coupling factor [Bacteroidales bacterium]
MLNRNPGAKISLKGLYGSSQSVFCASCLKNLHHHHLIILQDREEAAYFYNDLMNFFSDGKISFLPSSYKKSVFYRQTDSSNIILRTEILNYLSNNTGGVFIVTYPEAIAEKVLQKDTMAENTITIKVGQSYSLSDLEGRFVKNGFERVDFVVEPGQFSIRGGIVDIFSFALDHPCRIDFSGNEVDTIRLFDVEDQLSIRHEKEINVIPDIHAILGHNPRESLLQVLPAGSVIWSTDLQFVADRINDIYKQASRDDTRDDNNIEELLITGDLFLEEAKRFGAVEFGSPSSFAADLTLEFRTSSQPVFNKNFEILGKNLRENSDMGYTNYILSDNEKQFDRLRSIFHEVDPEVRFTPSAYVLHRGFIDHDMKICCYTDHQIFERYHKFRLRGNFSKREAISIKELNSLNPGDYVVHIDHGIGQFGGLERIEINGRTQEAVRIVYKDQDILFVRLHALHRISKYKGKDDTPPKINKLGSGAWSRLKQSTKRKVKDIARELIALYAKRKIQKGFAFSPDSYLQNELEASFLYEDTPDQLAATVAVKEGMESSSPMDRLVCGDVGFGKTEIAVRAAFKAVADSKQVALLVPTTILALQHYNTFRERLKEFPSNTDYLSRLKSPAEQKVSLQNLAEGKTDIIIGTHRLLGKDIRFKDLGLLIIDEEQKFGVTAKEKIRKMKMDVDTLILTATPIPRTLQFSLMGVRDLSIINTPPPNRHPIITELHTFDEKLIKEAIEYEVSRSGQVFFIHNRVDNIGEIEVLINRICPRVKAVVAHGQLEGKKLETIMLDFIRGDYDVLIATTIIESGLDIPNANTIFIHNAHQFGLSDLHQLRGRVGRSNRKAFCYLLAPPLTLITPEARRRLIALSEFSELGSGFNIAMQDLDIRGSGNLLGREQSGFIADIGFETYHRILNEAIRELKEEEFKSYFREEVSKQDASIKVRGELEKIVFVNDCVIDTDLELMFPETYIDNISERLRLYRELDNIKHEGSLKEFEERLTDRFGPVPEPGKELLRLVRLRWIALHLGFEKIVIRNGAMVLYFVSDQTSPYYKSPVFEDIVRYIQTKPGSFRLKETRGKLTLQVKMIVGVQAALKTLQDIRSFSGSEK